AMFEVQASRTPDLVAVVCEGERLTYAALDARATALADELLARNVRPQELVGVCLPRGVDMVVALLAVLKAGAPCVSLDPQYPPPRIADVLTPSGAALVITDHRS